MQNKSNLKSIHMFGVEIHPLSLQETVQVLDQFVHHKKFAHVIGINADKILQIKESGEMHEIVQRCEVVNADGFSLVIAAKILGFDIPERVAGIDLMCKVCEHADKNNQSIVLLGATQRIVIETEKKLKNQFQNLRILEAHHGYIDRADYPGIANKLLQLNPDYIFVGISSPKKEELIEYLRSEGLKSVCLGVGGSFDVVSGNISRAPVWVQKIGFEWFFRLLQEPERLGKRYIIGNAKFLILLFKEWLKGIQSR